MIVCITGATAGYGKAMVERYIQAGHRVIAIGRRAERLQALTAEHGDALLPVALNVCNEGAVLDALHNLPADWQAIEILINNAGLALGLELCPNTQLKDWETMVDTNIKGLLYMTHHVLPGMVARNRGHIVNVGSIAGSYPYAGGTVYGGSKAFVHQFSLALRADLLGKAIRVTCIEPGMSGGTEFSQVRFKGDAERAAAVYAGTTPLSAEDIAESVFWATSTPPHVNINIIELMPTCQAGPFQVHRNPRT